MYKIAVYAICGNEAHNIDEWMKSMWEADYICVLDTGSTDGSYEKLLDYQRQYPDKVIVDRKTYEVWRFDIPRNDSMKLVPPEADICICTDLDERLTPTWTEKIRAAWTPECERGYYLYAWSHMQDGSPGRVFWYDKIHKNSGLWQWQFPVHEALVHPVYGHAKLEPNQYCWLPADFIMLHHYPVYKATRKSYLPLLEMRADENPDDFFGLVYLAHEYKYAGKPADCINCIYTRVFPVIARTNDAMGCMTDLYMFLGDCYAQLGKKTEAIVNYKAGIATDPKFRDNYLQLAHIYLDDGKYDEAFEILNECVLKSRRMYSWFERDASWTWELWDLYSSCCYGFQNYEMGYFYAKMAYEEDPCNERLKNNYNWYRETVKNRQ